MEYRGLIDYLKCLDFYNRKYKKSSVTLKKGESMKNASILVVMMMTLLWLHREINNKKGEEKSCPVSEQIVATASIPEEIKIPRRLLEIIEALFPGNDVIISSNKQPQPRPGLEYNPVI